MDHLLVSKIQLYIQAFIQSFNAAYDSNFQEINGICIFYYGPEFSGSPNEVVPFQSVVFALEQSPEEIHTVLQSIHFPGNGTYAIQVFHESMDNKKQKLRYQALGYQYYLPNILQSIQLPVINPSAEMKVDCVEKPSQVVHINDTFADFKPFPEKLIHAQNCMSFFAEIDGKTAGWSYLVFPNSETAYVAGMFTAPAYRQQGVASALLNQMHQFAYHNGAKEVLLVPSFMAWNFYSRRGYQTIAHFSSFLPSRANSSDNSR